MQEISDPHASVNLQTANILLLEQSQHGLEVLAQMFLGFGARQLHRTISIEEATRVMERNTLDLAVVDPNLKGGDGYDFIGSLRRRGAEPNRSMPIIVVSADGSMSAVVRARDVGTSYFVVKPVRPAVLVDRIMRVVRDNRSFIVSDGYTGPDRRFKMEGPPPGIAPRRSTDITTRLGEATAPNMSQNEIDSLFKPQKVSL